MVSDRIGNRVKNWGKLRLWLWQTWAIAAFGYGGPWLWRTAELDRIRTNVPSDS